MSYPKIQSTMWKAESLLVKPDFDEAGRCPGRCPINKNYAIKAEGLLVKPDSKTQDDVL